MNARPVTDAQVSQALRAHLPARAQAGLRKRVFDATETTNQQRALPSFLGALSDADPVGRRRSLLIAAALLVAVAVASAAAVGALRLLQRDPIDELSLEPPADVPAFVLSSYERLPQLPPVALTWRDSDSTKGRLYVDQSGAVQFDQFASADATEPSSYRILSPNHRISGMASVESEAVWVEQGHEAIGDDPRVFLRTILSAGETGPGCEMERDSSEVANGSAAAGWRYVGLEYVAGRPTHHVACVGDLWIDIETRLILRTQGPAVDDAGQPVPVELPRSPRSPSASSRQRCSNRLTASPASRRTSTPPTSARGISRTSSCWVSRTARQRKRRKRRSPSRARRLPRRPPCVPSSNDCTVPPGDPSEPTGPLAWTPESLKEDWPAPVRPEPDGDARIQPIPLTYGDLIGDNGSMRSPAPTSAG